MILEKDIMKKKTIVIVIATIAMVLFLFVPPFFLEPKDWLPLLWIVPLTIAALFQEQIRRYLDAPELKIEFALETPYCSKTPFYAFFERKEEDKVIKDVLSTEAYYFRIKVINQGRSSAKLCEVVMTELLVEKDNKFYDVNYFQQVNLKWDTGKSKDAYITLNPSPVGMLCDIGYISRNYMPTLFNLEYLYTIGGYQSKELAPRSKYRFTLGIISENAKYITKTFEFYWTGQWKETEEEMFKEVSIKKIK